VGVGKIAGFESILPRFTIAIITHIAATVNKTNVNKHNHKTMLGSIF
jgi:hypothetical protein